MRTKNIYRRPVGNQDRFLIAMVNKNEMNKRRFVELCKEMHCNVINFENTSATEEYGSAVACEEVAVIGMFHDKKLIDCFTYAMNREEVMEVSNCETISIDKDITPEELRMKVFRSLLNGKLGIEYDDIDNKCIDCDCCKGTFFRYVQDMNYRVSEIGRTLMALKNRAIHNSSFISDSKILAEQALPEGCAIGELVDREGNRYLMIQNEDYTDKEKKAFRLQLKKKFRVYRVNPHNGKQILVKDEVDIFNVLVMPGDADLLRFQDAEDEPYFIEYIFQK